MKGEVLKKKANITRLTVFKDRTEPDFNPPSTASQAPETSRKRHPSTTIDNPKSSKRQCERQVIISDDEEDPEGKSQSDYHLYHIFKLSQLHQCGQGMPPKRFS